MKRFIFLNAFKNLVSCFLFEGRSKRSEVPDPRSENEFSKLDLCRLLNWEKQNILRLRIRNSSLSNRSPLTRTAQKKSSVFCRLFKKIALVGSA